jgi:4-carboxymuconolactone decarboxylase
MTDERAKRAREIRDRLFGAPAEGSADAEPQLPIEKELVAITEAHAFGDIWSRGTIPMKTRSLLTLGILTALYRPDQVRIHVKGALNIGLTPEEILEAIYHAGAYAGIPAANSARMVAREVFKSKGLLK